MQLHFNDMEQAFSTPVEQIVAKFLEPPREYGVSPTVHSVYSPELRAALWEGGFLNAAREPDFGAVCAALLVEIACRSPFAAEVGTSALVAAQMTELDLAAPVAIAFAKDLDRPIRNLSVAKMLLVIDGGRLLLTEVDQTAIETNGGMYAYPYGCYRDRPDLSRAEQVGDGGRAISLWQAAIAVEGAALMQAALDLTVQYVKDRRQFGRALGSFQAIGHRLALSSQKARGAMWLARRAVWSGSARDAAMAALYVQQAIPQITYDCHQFHGAMGMTLEYPLHFWTYRLKALQGELGGQAFQAARFTESHWS